MFKYLGLSLLLLLALMAGHAQETSGSLQGRIRDTAGLPLSGATVVAVHQPSGTRYTTVASNGGTYYLPNLRIGGPYLVQVSYTGMSTQTRQDLSISLGDPVRLDFLLTPTGISMSQAVTVTANRRNRPNTYGTGYAFSRDQIANMPTTSRSITDITRMVPQGSKDNSFGGSNFRYNNVTIDGAINNDAIGFSPSIGGQTGTSGMPGSSTRTNPISLDAIEDIQVYLAPYDVKIGNFTGGSINAVTRSGTNEIHGSLYGYGRNATITGPDNAGDGTKMPKDFYEYQTGFRLGLPIVKNKIFFFTNEEITRRQDPILQPAGSAPQSLVISQQDAQAIRDITKSRYGFDPGTYGQFNVYSNSNKLFNRLDWNINDRHQLSIRNNTIHSEATNLERDQTDFRFGSIAYQQVNDQVSTVAELKSRFSNSQSNSLIVGYTYVHDYRNPSSDPAFPQVQIVGETPGATIFFGTDREASIFNMKQKTLELTDNFTWNLGKHKLLMGTHNELYSISYGFVNSWNGRVDYASISDFFNNFPSRVRGSYNYSNNDRSYILSHPAADFNVDFLSAYLQDEIKISETFSVTPGIRADYSFVPAKQALSEKTRLSPPDVYYGTTYTYTPMNQITQNYLGIVQLSPRLGFRYDALPDHRLILRGGMGLFTGRIPFAWLGYAFYNTGNSYGAFDRRQDNGSSQLKGDPLQYGKQGIAPYAAQNGEIVNNVNGGKTQVDLVDNHFVMPKVFRSSLAIDYTDGAGFHYNLEGIFTKTVKDVQFKQLNQQDNPTYNYYDLTLQRQPIFSSQVNPGAFTNVYEMSNTGKGYRYSLTGQISRKFPIGLEASLAYTYGHAEDISNGIRNSMESNWQLNQALNPNNPGRANSNFDIRHRILASLSYGHAWNKSWNTHLSIFVNSQSGSPFTYGFVNYTPQGTPQQVALAYIPNRGEAINFFQDQNGTPGHTTTAAAQAKAFNDFIDADSYLRSRRGAFTERNGARTPWNTQADAHFAQDFLFGSTAHRGQTGSRHVLTFSLDIINLTNLLDKKWGRVYFVPNTYNSTASVGLAPFTPGHSALGYPIYQFVDPGKPWSIDFFQSRWQMQMGLRYSF